jgi:hypothetical protein
MVPEFVDVAPIGKSEAIGRITHVPVRSMYPQIPPDFAAARPPLKERADSNVESIAFFPEASM